MRRVIHKIALLLAVLASVCCAAADAQEYTPGAPWQSQGNRPAPKSRLGGRGGWWPSDGSNYAQAASHNVPAMENAAFESVDGIPSGVVSETIDGEEYAPFDGEDSLPMESEMGDPVFHEGQDALIPEGLWTNRLNNWYVNSQVTLLQRQSPAKTPISTERILTINSLGQTVQIFRPVQQARHLRFGVAPGLRLTVGRNLFTDIVNRQHSVEFSFVGLNHWRTDSEAIGGPGSSTSTALIFPGLYSGFPITQGGFNGASLHRLYDSSNMNNYELNYRISQQPRPDRVVQYPDGRWVRRGTPSMVGSALVGFRAVTIDEHFLWLSSGTYQTGESFTGSYQMDTSNNLFGAQFGGDVFAQYNIFSLGVRGKAGVYGNAAKRLAGIQITDPVFGNQTASFLNGKGRASCIADLNLIATARLAKGINFRFSYDFMWCGGLINAPEQQQYTLQGPGKIVDSGRMLFQGVGLGIDAYW